MMPRSIKALTQTSENNMSQLADFKRKMLLFEANWTASRLQGDNLADMIHKEI
jgi:hypothetical protein